ncbi:hypothetical protein EV421DRAFT_1993963 [Armillaria borealis]|uniref:Uncharacterized protein n=1 Tax=Armillaria borealis TaxID=47425 RepID=A0AA39J265_9AGAR|nr:hypothetical protein EV421DRAFT_1993963 [Armillaria borealis]
MSYHAFRRRIHVSYEIHTIDKNLRPVTLTGDVIALTDSISKTVIYNWKTDGRAYLDDGGGSHHNRCFEVIFTPSTILVVRKHCIKLYTRPRLLHRQTLTPTAAYSFGWVAFVSAPTPALYNPLSVLIRTNNQSDNFRPLIKLHSLASFPPILTSNISSPWSSPKRQ